MYKYIRFIELMRRRQSAGVLSGRRYVSTAINVPVPKYQRTSVSVVDGQAPVGVVDGRVVVAVVGIYDTQFKQCKPIQMLVVQT